MQKQILKMLEYVDNTLVKAKPIYEAGASCSVFFGASVIFEEFLIGEKHKREVENELKKRDNGTPMLDWYEGRLYSVIIHNPWG